MTSYVRTSYNIEMPPDKVKEISEKINAGQVGVIPTDTIYGIVASAFQPDSVARIYEIKGRPTYKKMITLIAGTNQLSQLGISLTSLQKEKLKKFWPGPTSVELKCEDEEKAYLHHGTLLLAIRLPKPKWLRDLIALTGPIVATSANVSGKEVARDIDIIHEQLPGLDFYIKGTVGSNPSKIIAINKDGQITEFAR